VLDPSFAVERLRSAGTPDRRRSEVGTEFDTEEVFDDDYLYFYEPLLSDERSEAETDLVCSLGPVEPGDRVLDLACGHGRIANRLAERGASVTGLDLTPRFLELARADATRRGVHVEYVQGNMAELARAESFDVVLSWFTSFGYFDDAGNRRVLGAIHRSLKPAGRLLLELNHAPALWAGFLPSVVSRRGDDLMIDQHRYDALTGRVHDRRTVVRGGKVRSFRFSNRLFAFPELRDWLLGAGFQRVEAFGPDGLPLTHQARRMIVRAVR
jgi:SAM-dependent methyltransferase